MHAARIGVTLKGCSANVTWPPCTRSARSLTQAGVQTGLYPAGVEIPERWHEDFQTSTEMFHEANVDVRAVDMARHDAEWAPWFENLNDGTNEGLKSRTRPIFSVQFHPEGRPGPLDTEFLFGEFLRIASSQRTVRSA